ncbi:MAG: ribosome recycling factor [Cycloclasticus sp.]|nr:ribosome recycling factor [Cycloclasticus sp.]MBG96830.1 ribosome recycling factor [Cycloclasticus sp.]|tara:strand:+ start:332 stop:889 length:558 start_codon:yes stop_codon:yes gene_type:complete
MIEDIVKDGNVRMGKSVESFQKSLTKVRTGRAHPSLLEDIVVSYYDVDTPLNQVATVNVEDARTLSIMPWEAGMIAPVEKAIMKADLGLNPVTAGNVIRVPMPPLTEERRRELVKVVRNEAEGAKVAIRNIRRDANSEFKEALKEKMITEDELRSGEEKIQKITDSHVKEIDKLLEVKEADLMSM